MDDEPFDEFFEKILQYRLKGLEIILPDQTTNQIEGKHNLISSIIVQCGLEELNLNLLNGMFINDTTWKLIESLVEHLTIDCCTSEEYHRILSSCNQLKMLTIKSFSYTETFPSFVSSSLTTLMFDAHSLSIEDLYEIVSLTPYLLHLRMNISNFSYSEIICGQSLEKFLENHLSHLIKFEF